MATRKSLSKVSWSTSPFMTSRGIPVATSPNHPIQISAWVTPATRKTSDRVFLRDHPEKPEDVDDEDRAERHDEAREMPEKDDEEERGIHVSLLALF